MPEKKMAGGRKVAIRLTPHRGWVAIRVGFGRWERHPCICPSQFSLKPLEPFIPSSVLTRMTKTNLLLASLLLASLLGCTDNSQLRRKPLAKYKVTLYSGQYAQRVWYCDDFRYYDNPQLIKGGRIVAFIHGTYTIEPINPAEAEAD